MLNFLKVDHDAPQLKTWAVRIISHYSTGTPRILTTMYSAYDKETAIKTAIVDHTRFEDFDREVTAEAIEWPETDVYNVTMDRGITLTPQEKK